MDCYSFTDESSLQTEMHLPLLSDSELPIASNIQRREFIPDPDDIIYAGMTSIELDYNLETAEIPGDPFADNVDLSLYTVDKGCDSPKIPSDSTDTDSPPVLLDISPVPQKNSPEKSGGKSEGKYGGLQKRRRLSTRHSPQQAFQECSQCGKSFSSASALSKHYLTHSHERRHVCRICNKAFKRQDHLSGHLLTHQKNKPYVCMEHGCDKSYCDSRSLRRHYEVQHGLYCQREPFADNSSKEVDSTEGVLYPQSGQTQTLQCEVGVAQRPTTQVESLSQRSCLPNRDMLRPLTSSPPEEVSATFSSGALHKLDSFAQAFTRQNLDIQSNSSVVKNQSENSSMSEFDTCGNVFRQLLSYKTNLNQWQAYPEQKREILQEQYSLHQQHQQQIATSLFTQVYMGDQEASPMQNQDQFQNHMLHLISDTQYNLSQSQNSFQATKQCQLSKNILSCYPQETECTDQQTGTGLQPVLRGISECHKKSKKSPFKGQCPPQSMCEEVVVQNQLQSQSEQLEGKSSKSVSISRKERQKLDPNCTAPPSQVAMNSFPVQNSLTRNMEDCLQKPSFYASVQVTDNGIEKMEHGGLFFQYLEDKLSALLLKKPLEENVAVPLVIPVSVPVKSKKDGTSVKSENSPVTPRKSVTTKLTDVIVSSNDSSAQVTETGKQANVNCRGNSKKQRKKRSRPDPLFIPSPASNQTGVLPGMVLYQSHMRSPVCLADHLLEKNFQPPPYTPPPMLSPIRHGSGLYFNRICSLSGSKASHNTYPPKGILANGVDGICGISVVKDDSIVTIEPHINIGTRFQAEIPLLQDKSLLDDSVHQADLVWKPWDDIETNKITQTRVTDLLNLACSSVLPGGGTNLELALHCLHDTRGDILAALDMLLMKGVRRDPCHPLGDYHYTGTEKWTTAEKRLFNRAICLNNKDFFLMQKMIKHKTVAQCVEYYYTWKKQLKFEWKRTHLLEEDEIKPEAESPADGKEIKKLVRNAAIYAQSCSESTSIPSQTSVSREKLKKKIVRAKPNPSPSVHCQTGVQDKNEKKFTVGNFPCKECTKVFDKVKSRNAHMKCHRQQEEQERQAEMKRSRIRVKAEPKEEPEETVLVFTSNNTSNITTS
ncbi:zinc finger protein 541-like [Hemiscyllium ocellatum]|uniref:zinc finger protein 541-like n=1 Tax=Hemiscyllium ocellatum TaxID=170820 RepID=UPI0029671439|nr:zinc finger protein 541-like [Hemiscyllium ocellatum]